MNRFSLVLLMIFISLVSSCSGSAVQPDVAPASEPSIASGGPHLWGFWDVEWNPETNEFDAVPLRSAMFACNVIKFMNAHPTNLAFHTAVVKHEDNWTNFDLDIGLIHPFPGLEAYDGFDVMGIFMGNGSAHFPGPEGYAIAGPDDQQLLNADGYTRRFNATEFSGAGQILPLQGYLPGGKGSLGYTPTAILNPYKYYADSLTANADAFGFLVTHSVGRGVFKPGSANFRHFKIRMPNNLLKFQYAVLANWEPGKNHPDPPDSLDDFPAAANSQEAVALDIVDSSTAFYDDESTYGGDIILDITPWDWSATCSPQMEEYTIKLRSSAWTGAFSVDMTPAATAQYHYTFHADIPVETLSAYGSLPIWVEVGYPDYDYSSPVGVPNDATGHLTAYFETSAYVTTSNPPVSDNCVYGFSDSHFMEDVDEPATDNPLLFANMLNLPKQEPYVSNKIVMWYEGHSDGYKEWPEFSGMITDMGYQNVYVPADPYTPLDTTGVKMLILATMYSKVGDYYTTEEVQLIRDFVNGGGICIILLEKKSFYVDGTDTVDKLISDLELDIKCHADDNYDDTPYTDITPDPITEGVDAIFGDKGARFEVFGNGVSLVRGTHNGDVFTAICKSPMGN